jgi:DNA-binding CsgD family transcriptional regulator
MSAMGIGASQSSQIFTETPWRAYVEGDNAAIDAAAKRGALLFLRDAKQGGADCASCHAGDFFTDEASSSIATASTRKSTPSGGRGPRRKATLEPDVSRQGGVGTRRRFGVSGAPNVQETPPPSWHGPCIDFNAMNPHAAAPIDVAEAAYDLRLGPKEWLPNLLEKGAPLFDRGLGCAAAIWAGRSADQQPMMAQLTVRAGEPDLGLMFARAARDVGMRLPQTSAARDGGACTASETDTSSPSILRAFEKQVGCKDVLGVWALDPRLHGIGINIPSSQFIALSRPERRRWRALSAHIAAGHRLRRKLGSAAVSGAMPVNELPFEGDAIIDPTRFVITHAKGHARRQDAAQALREAAIQVDHARGKLRNEHPDEALAIWQGLVEGRWSLVDWFDTDGRRFVVVVPNRPGTGDPRGLTQRERDVVELAARGNTSKLISYQLGVSTQRVSMLLASAKRKLGVRTQAQLVLKMKPFLRSAAARA